jgi:transposase
MANEFWLSDAQWSAIDPLLRKNRPGARRVDDRRVISGIVHVLKIGFRWHTDGLASTTGWLSTQVSHELHLRHAQSAHRANLPQALSLRFP